MLYGGRWGKGSDAGTRSKVNMTVLLRSLIPILALAWPAQDPQPTGLWGSDPAAILSIIPADCWGFVEIHNLRALDDKLAKFLEQVGMPPFRVMELLQTRLNLGPTINYDSGLAVVFLPADSFANMGLKAVLLFPCQNVESLLSEFPTEKLRSNLWRSELVWGPTFVGRRKNFAVFATSEEAATAVLGSKKSISARITGPVLEELQHSDVNVWINARALASSAAMENTRRKETQAADDRAIFGADSMWATGWNVLDQIESAHVGLHFDAKRIKITSSIRPLEGSSLSKLLAFDPPSGESPLSLLPDQPFILAAAGQATPAQMRTTAAELDKLFDSESIRSGTVPERLMQFRQVLKTLVESIKGTAGALSTQPQSPKGLAAVVGVLKVGDAPAWIANVEQAAGLLGHGFFVNESAKRYFNKISYQSHADTITGVPVHHLMLDLIEHPPGATEKKLDFGAALGSAQTRVQIAAVDRQTIAFCAGDHPRLMAALLSSARGQARGLDQYAGLAKVKPFLPRMQNMLMLFQPEELIRLGRTLARMQQKIEEFSYQMLGIGTPVGVTVTGGPKMCRIEAVVPIDLAAALKSALLQTPAGQPDLELAPKEN